MTSQPLDHWDSGLLQVVGEAGWSSGAGLDGYGKLNLFCLNIVVIFTFNLKMVSPFSVSGVRKCELGSGGASKCEREQGFPFPPLAAISDPWL
jgi:hypothetical protein